MSILLLLIAAIIAAIGQVFLKQSAINSKLPDQNEFYFVLYLIKNPYSWLGALCYALSFLLYMIALKNINLTYARSFSALSYILVIILSIIIFKDNINFLTIIGISLIACGIFIVGIGYK